MNTTKNVMKFVLESSMRTLFINWIKIENSLFDTNNELFIDNGQFIKRNPHQA